MRAQNKAKPQTAWISQSPFKSGEVDQLMPADYVVPQTYVHCPLINCETASDLNALNCTKPLHSEKHIILLVSQTEFGGVKRLSDLQRS